MKQILIFVRRNWKKSQRDLIEILFAICTMLKTMNKESSKRDFIKQTLTNHSIN